MAMNSSNWCGASEQVDERGVDWTKALRFARPKLREAARAELEVAPSMTSRGFRANNFVVSSTRLRPGDCAMQATVVCESLCCTTTCFRCRRVRRSRRSSRSPTSVKSDCGCAIAASMSSCMGKTPVDTLLGPRPRSQRGSGGSGAPDAGRFISRTIRTRRTRLPRPGGSAAGAARTRRRPSAPTAPMVRLHAITGRRRSEDVGMPASEIAPLWRSTMDLTPPPFNFVYGRSVDEVYERLQSWFFEHGERRLHDLICVIEAPQSHGTVPAGYPPTGEADEPRWFSALVKWWQLKESRVIGHSKLLPFNHGERIYGWSGDAVARGGRRSGPRPDDDALDRDPRRPADRSGTQGTRSTRHLCLYSYG